MRNAVGRVRNWWREMRRMLSSGQPSWECPMVRLKFLLAVLALSAAPSANAQNYPNRAITIVVPFAQGGLTDVPVRLFASVMQEKLGVPVVVENKTGGSGSVGATHVL